MSPRFSYIPFDELVFEILQFVVLQPLHNSGIQFGRAAPQEGNPGSLISSRSTAICRIVRLPMGYKYGDLGIPVLLLQNHERFASGVRSSITSLTR